MFRRGKRGRRFFYGEKFGSFFVSFLGFLSKFEEKECVGMCQPDSWILNSVLIIVRASASSSFPATQKIDNFFPQDFSSSSHVKRYDEGVRQCSQMDKIKVLSVIATSKQCNISGKFSRPPSQLTFPSPPLFPSSLSYFRDLLLLFRRNSQFFFSL